ncbi:hypothetical protein EFA69_09380 [Rufibacter immobilis]|uniref:PKD domain-containing protein n=2 Tax=Rufibacter immobilis TaxID=1348778 RepID=A0A3M9MYA9_9BACT|nr:hypothetical protein EFA69_09380 [Rufibacter immobilis]
MDDPELDPVPTADQINFTVTPDPENSNILHFRSTSTGIAMWDFGNGAEGKGTEVQAAYPIANEYTVTLTLLTNGGVVTKSQKVTIATTNPLMLEGPIYTMLTGGPNQLEGKTWIVDRNTYGHMGVGPVGGTTPEWWQAPPNDKASEGLYDDEMTFKLAGFSYIYNNNGKSFSNGANAPGLGGTAGDDVTLDYTPPANMNWSLVEGAKNQIVISKGGFMGFYTGTSTYEILSITNDELYVRHLDAATPANAWYQRFIRKGYQRPVTPKPIKSVNINDNFDDNGNVTWNLENILLNESYDNPAPTGINTSKKVALYTRQGGQANQYGNAYIQYTHKLDLSQRHVFKIKVLVPSYNDYTTMGGAESWSPVKTLQKQLSVKLQNSELGGNAYTTQTEVIQQVTQLGEWVELTFDFGAAATRQDYDRIVIQFGGEAHWNPGIFFLDDFRLEP